MAEEYPALLSLSEATTDHLQNLIRSFPIIDNHAHNILTQAQADGDDKYSFELITSEARGPALEKDSPSSLAHVRGIKQLACLFQCPATLDDVKKARKRLIEEDYARFVETCLKGTHAILIDDGLKPENEEDIIEWESHGEYGPKVLRIVRIETLAEKLIQELARVFSGGGIPDKPSEKSSKVKSWEMENTIQVLMRFNIKFRDQILEFAGDPKVCGFKSVVCYRSGLSVDVDPKSLVTMELAVSGVVNEFSQKFHNYMEDAVKKGNFRVNSKPINDALVILVCMHLTTLAHQGKRAPPFQFHTGLGDTDLNLLQSNPAHLQKLIHAFEKVDFVLLHSSYPYTREAGYLAAHFSNVWLDIGEVFPMVSRDGQVSILRQALELVPQKKVLWSTDGHYFPETFFLANIQFREGLEKVLLEYVAAGDLSVAQAIETAGDIMFGNSNKLYKLGEDEPSLLQFCAQREPVQRTLAFSPAGESGAEAFQGTSGTVPAATGSNPFFSPIFFNWQCSDGVSKFDGFLKQYPSVKYIWVQFLDYTATMRLRIVPVTQFRKHLSSGQYPSMTLALTRLLQNDHLAPNSSASGQFILAPDISTLAPNVAINSTSATVQTWWMQDLEEDGPPTKRLEGCPRWTLQQQVNDLQSEYNINILMGFEIEIIFMRPVLNSSKSDFTDFEPLHMCHSWSSMTTQQVEILPMVERIVSVLEQGGIHIPQFHSEAAPGQWEFILPAYEPLKAVDTLYRARDIIRSVAKEYELRATLHPRPFSFSCGSASHTHFSINGPGDTVANYQDSFLAGVLEHLPSILAFTLPQPESYERVMAGIWAGGIYVTWGTQNRETPLRKCGPGHWELKSVDGLGNMYFSMAALLASGLHGLRRNMPLTHKDCVSDASNLTDEERRELGIVRLLPNELSKSLAALKEDETLCMMLGKQFVEHYFAIKAGEMEALVGMDPQTRRVWLVSRY